MMIKLNMAAFVCLIFFITACGGLKMANDINGDFENNFDDDEHPDGWTANQFGRKYALLSIDNSISYSGDRSISIEIYKTHGSGNTIYNWIRSSGGIKNGIYELTGWIRTRSAVRSPYIEVQFWNNIENRIITSVTTRKMFSIVGNTEWRRVNAIFRIPPGTTKVLIRAAVDSRDNQGCKVWFDDIRLEKISS